jgi:hypothetical protein
MTPKEKAKELFSKYYNSIEHTLSEEYSPHEMFVVEQCVLIAVNEMIIQNGELFLNGLDGDYYRKKNAFLFEVKQELEKL